MKGRKKKPLTQEQIDWRNSILRGKVSEINNKPTEVILHHDDKIRQTFYYLNNCVYRINLYIDGFISENELLNTAKAIQVNAKQLELLLSKPKPTTK